MLQAVSSRAPESLLYYTAADVRLRQSRKHLRKINDEFAVRVRNDGKIRVCAGCNFRSELEAHFVVFVIFHIMSVLINTNLLIFLNFA